MKSKTITKPSPQRRSVNTYIYARVSSKEQEQEGFSLEHQTAHLQKYAEDHGLRVTNRLEESCTAKESGRPKFSQMMTEVKQAVSRPSNGTKAVILVEKMDRLTRNYSDEAGKRFCILLTDNDKEAKSAKRIHETNKMHGTWLHYEDLTKDQGIVTGEDFLKIDFFRKKIMPIANSIHTREKWKGPKMTASILKDKVGIMAIFKDWIAKQKLVSGEPRKFVSELKNKMFSTATKGDIKSSYAEVIAGLEKKLR